MNLKKNSCGVLVDVRMNSTVVAAAKTDYVQGVGGEQKEAITLLEASVTSKSNPKFSYSAKNAPLSPKTDEPGVTEWHGKKIPLSKGDTLTTYFHYTVQKDAKDFYVLYFGAPAICPTLRIVEHDGLEVHASKADQQNDTEYLYQKVFLVGDHINIRWWPKISN